MQSSKTDFLEQLASCRGIIFKVARMYCRDEQDRQDLVQEILAQMWTAYPRYDRQFKFSTWTYRVALNIAISYLRREGRKNKIFKPLELDVDVFEDIEPDLQARERFSRLNQFILELKDLDKALMLLFLEEKSYWEIAQIMGISESNVATKVGRIKEKLKAKFKA